MVEAVQQWGRQAELARRRGEMSDVETSTIDDCRGELIALKTELRM